MLPDFTTPSRGWRHEDAQFWNWNHEERSN